MQIPVWGICSAAAPVIRCQRGLLLPGDARARAGVGSVTWAPSTVWLGSPCRVHRPAQRGRQDPARRPDSATSTATPPCWSCAWSTRTRPEPCSSMILGWTASSRLRTSSPGRSGSGRIFSRAVGVVPEHVVHPGPLGGWWFSKPQSQGEPGCVCTLPRRLSGRSKTRVGPSDEHVADVSGGDAYPRRRAGQRGEGEPLGWHWEAVGVQTGCVPAADAGLGVGGDIRA